MHGSFCFLEHPLFQLFLDFLERFPVAQQLPFVLADQFLENHFAGSSHRYQPPLIYIVILFMPKKDKNYDNFSKNNEP